MAAAKVLLAVCLFLSSSMTMGAMVARVEERKQATAHSLRGEGRVARSEIVGEGSSEIRLFERILNASVCRQSSTIDDHSCFFALDGDFQTFSLTMHHRGVWPWLELDLGKSNFVSHVKIWVAAYPGQSNDAPLMLLATNNSIIGLRNHHARELLESAFSANVNATFEKSVQVAVVRAARYIVLQRRGLGGSLSIAEMQIIGTPSCGNFTCVHGTCMEGNATENAVCNCDRGFGGPNCDTLVPREDGALSTPSMIWLAAATACGSLGTCLVALVLRIMCNNKNGSSSASASTKAKMAQTRDQKRNGTADEGVMLAPLLHPFVGHEPAIAFLFASPSVHCRPSAQPKDATDGRREEASGGGGKVIITPLKQLDILSEQQRIMYTTQRSAIPVHLDSIPLTETNLRCVISHGMHEIIHISCHSHNASLIFESDDGAAHVVDAERVNSIFQINAGRSNIRVLLFNGCGSLQVASRLRLCNVAVIATRERVSDDVARNFSHHFYMSLLCAQKHIDESFAIAKDALISGYGKGKADNFVLLSSCTGDIKRRAFRNHGIGDFSRMRKPLPQPFLPILPEDKIERSGDVFRVCQALRHRRVITLSGEKGIGKSVLAADVARFLGIRRASPTPECYHADGVIWLPLAGKSADLAFKNLSERLQEKSKLARCVVILDQSDGVLGVRMHALLSHYLHELPYARFIITSRVSPFAKSSSFSFPDTSSVFHPVEIEITPLTRVEAARLFLSRVQRKLSMEEILETVDDNCSHKPGYDEHEGGDSLEDTLAYSRVITALNGHPLRISQVASTVASPQRKLSDVDMELCSMQAS